MKKINVTIYILFIFLFSSTLCTAQKSGHLNFNNILAIMPQTTIADSELEAYQKTLVQQGEEMTKLFQEEYNNFVKQAQNGDIAPLQQQEIQETLQKKQQQIVAYEQETVQRINQKREQLLTPILERVQKAIAEVALENGYELVFDTGIFNAVLYTMDSDDLMPLVKRKLGI